MCLGCYTPLVNDVPGLLYPEAGRCAWVAISPYNAICRAAQNRLGIFGQSHTRHGPRPSELICLLNVGTGSKYRPRPWRGSK